MLNSEQNDEVSDTRDDDQGTEADINKKVASASPRKMIVVQKMTT
jgi:hypothetical protein